MQSSKQAANHFMLSSHLIPRPLMPSLTPSSYVIDHRRRWLIAGRYLRHCCIDHTCILVYVYNIPITLIVRSNILFLSLARDAAVPAAETSAPASIAS